MSEFIEVESGEASDRLKKITNDIEMAGQALGIAAACAAQAVSAFCAAWREIDGDLEQRERCETRE